MAPLPFSMVSGVVRVRAPRQSRAGNYRRATSRVRPTPSRLLSWGISYCILLHYTISHHIRSYYG